MGEFQWNFREVEANLRAEQPSNRKLGLEIFVHYNFQGA